MHVDLVKTTTADGLRLDGAYQASHAADDAPQHDLTMLCLHGAGSNFYSGGVFEHLTPRLLDAGFHVLRVNTRGHDGYFAGRTAVGAARLGAAYEHVADCCLDIKAWIDWLATHRAPTRVLLLGHSLGAIKAIYAMAEQPDPRIVCVIALSPPRLSCTTFQWGAPSESFTSTLLQAKALVAQGRPREILESTFPFPMLITAESFIDKYGGERYNVVELAPRVQRPMIFVYGQIELEHGGVAFAGLPQALSAQRHADQVLQMHIIDGADHFYVGCYDALSETLLQSVTELRYLF